MILCYLVGLDKIVIENALVLLQPGGDEESPLKVPTESVVSAVDQEMLKVSGEHVDMAVNFCNLVHKQRRIVADLHIIDDLEHEGPVDHLQGLKKKSCC